MNVSGFPNVGKSSLINSLKRARACNVGATPGVTKCVLCFVAIFCSSFVFNHTYCFLPFTQIKLFFRCLQEVHLDKYIKLLDCPGIVMATSTSDAAMILRNCVKIEQLVDPIPPVEAILRRCNTRQVPPIIVGILSNDIAQLV